MSSNTVDTLYDLAASTPEQRKLFFGKMRESKKGAKAKMASIGIGSPEKIMYIQTPRMFCPFPPDKNKSDSGYESMRILVQNKSDSKGATEFGDFVRDDVDQAAVTYAFENQKDMFDTPEKDYKSRELIKERYVSLLRKNEPYDDQLSFKIDEGRTFVYTKVGVSEPVRVDDIMSIDGKITARFIIQIGPMWVTGSPNSGFKFGVQAHCKQMLVISSGSNMKRDVFAAKLMMKDSDDDDEAAEHHHEEVDESK